MRGNGAESSDTLPEKDHDQHPVALNPKRAIRIAITYGGSILF
jgi:hypothetical protein